MFSELYPRRVKVKTGFRCMCVLKSHLPPPLSLRTMWIQLWISPRFLQACWPWITCCILPGTTRTPTSGWACTEYILTFSSTPCRDSSAHSDFCAVGFLLVTSASSQTSFPPAHSPVCSFTLVPKFYLQSNLHVRKFFCPCGRNDLILCSVSPWATM